MWSALLVAMLAAPSGGSSSSWVPTNAPNLNGAYRLSPTPLGSKGKIAWAESYASWPGGTMMFDAYSPPFETLYSQVWWAGLPPLPLPDHVIQQFSGGKIMAIVGFECDQVSPLTGGGPSFCYDSARAMVTGAPPVGFAHHRSMRTPRLSQL